MQVPHLVHQGTARINEQLERAYGLYRERVGYRAPIRIVGYRGFGTDDAIFLKGRVLADPAIESALDDPGLRNFFNMLRRYRATSVPDARIRVSLNGRHVEVTADNKGYFDAVVEPGELDNKNGLWHPVKLTLVEPHPNPDVNQEFFDFSDSVQVPAEARFGVISDIDDTIVHTGATNLMRHARVVLFNSPHTRVPFEGIGAFYRALQSEQGTPTNPIWYVSSSPWNIYELLVEFMEVHEIPLGPIFLKDFGIDREKFIRAGHIDYKIDRIRRLLRTYPDLPFILVGDSGQRDPEVYRAVVEEFSDQIQAVYLRDVAPERVCPVEEIARQIRSSGVDVLLMADTIAAAEHACQLGWIDASDVDAVRDDRRKERRNVPIGIKAAAKKVGRSLVNLLSYPARAVR